MTTLPSLFTEEIFIKGKPLRLDDLTTVENNVITINATIAGLTGVKPPSDNSGETIRSRAPTSQMMSMKIGMLLTYGLPTRLMSVWTTARTPLCGRLLLLK